MTDEAIIDQKVIIFQLNDEEYGIPVQQVRSIERVQHITRVPGAASFVKGVINLRGVVTPIIDLRTRFNFAASVYQDSTRIIVAAINDLEVGLIVDSANDVIDIPIAEIEPPPEVVGVVESEYINGVARVNKRLLILLNLDKVLNPEQLNEFKKVEA